MPCWSGRELSGLSVLVLAWWSIPICEQPGRVALVRVGRYATSEWRWPVPPRRPARFRMRISSAMFGRVKGEAVVDVGATAFVVWSNPEKVWKLVATEISSAYRRPSRPWGRASPSPDRPSVPSSRCTARKPPANSTRQRRGPDAPQQVEPCRRQSLCQGTHRASVSGTHARRAQVCSAANVSSGACP